MSTRWSTATKFWVLTAATIFITITVYRLRSVAPLVALAVILAYIISPVVDRIERNTPVGRTLATALVYLSLLALISTVPATFAPGILEEARSIDRELVQNLILDIIERVQAYNQDSVISVFGFAFDLAPLYQQVIESLQSFSTTMATSSLGFFLNFASGFASTVLGIFLTLVLSFYLVKDSHFIVEYLENQIPETYHDEIVGLVQNINQVWRDFLRGQIVLVLVVGSVTWLGLFILGVPNALLLAILAGLLEVIPNLGPVLAAIPAVLIAFFQGSTHLGLAPIWFALAVLLLYVVIQQVENTVLVPRIIGGSVHLHPVVILIGVLAGADIAGILGVFLAAPVLASIRVIGSYAYDKLLEPTPTAETPGEEAEAEVPAEEEEITQEAEEESKATEEQESGGKARPASQRTAAPT